MVLYQDVLIGLDMTRIVNNGSPALHVGLLHKAGVLEGSMSCTLVRGLDITRRSLPNSSGRRGQVTAVEYDSRLAAMAK